MTLLIAPSLLAADFSQLKNEIEQIERAGADWLHLDIMDGHFVPNITFGPPLVASVRKISSLFLDAHLMVVQPERFLDAFAQAGVNGITVHVETSPSLTQTLARIRQLGLKAGLSLKPGTPFEALIPYLNSCDLILFMSVEPGFGGQTFMTEVLPKIRQAKKWIQQHASPHLIQVDGGITLQTAPEAVAAGAEILVAGTAIFGKPNPAEIISQMKNLKSL